MKPEFEVDCEYGGDRFFDETLAVAELLYNDVCFVNTRKYLSIEGAVQPSTVVVFAICNDAFAWACADAEEIDNVEGLWRAWKQDGEDGVIRWIALKRNARPIKPHEERMRRNGSWTIEMDALPMNSCPLCGNKVLFVGLNDLECSGTTTDPLRAYAGPSCPNKTKTPVVQEMVFDDTLVDWTWFVPFCAWLGAKAGGSDLLADQALGGVFRGGVR